MKGRVILSTPTALGVSRRSSAAPRLRSAEEGGEPRLLLRDQLAKERSLVIAGRRAIRLTWRRVDLPRAANRDANHRRHRQRLERRGEARPTSIMKRQ
jgi:hypothetical protein